MGLKSHAITAETPKNLLFSAAVFYKNLKYDSEKGWNGTVFGATSRGTKFSIAPEYTDAELDGATVLVRGSKIKTGETASIEAQVTEFTEGIIVDCLHLVEDEGNTVNGYKVYKSKRSLDDEDYLENMGIVGTLVSGEQIIVILPNALVTSAFEVETKNKEQATYSIVAECHASFEQEDLEHLPYEIYYPQTPAV